MRFVVEEASWAWDGTERDAYIERIEQLLDRLDVARERGEAFATSTELLEQKVHGDRSLGELLWDAMSPLALPQEVIQRLAALFNTLRRWDDDLELVEFDVAIDGRHVISPSAGLAHNWVSQGIALACVPLPGTWQGAAQVLVGTESQAIHFVVNEQTHRDFFRDALNVERADATKLAELAPHAFPDLLFLNDCWDGIKQLQGGYERVRGALHELLGVLDDHGCWIFTDATGRLSRDEHTSTPEDDRPVTNQIIERRFKRWGYNVAPEKPDVRRDGGCRRARERVLQGRTLYCEWHFKFEPHVNRLHLHPPVAESGYRVIVAIISDHLPLPRN